MKAAGLIKAKSPKKIIEVRRVWEAATEAFDDEAPAEVEAFSESKLMQADSAADLPADGDGGARDPLQQDAHLAWAPDARGEALQGQLLDQVHLVGGIATTLEEG